jgi:hypothetical protein
MLSGAALVYHFVVDWEHGVIDLTGSVDYYATLAKRNFRPGNRGVIPASGRSLNRNSGSNELPGVP